jgi:hypothetical protein
MYSSKGVGEKVLEKLGQLTDGVDQLTCAQLCRLPTHQLVSLLGSKTADKLLMQCRGESEKQFDMNEPIKSVSCDINYSVRLLNVSWHARRHMHMSRWMKRISLWQILARKLSNVLIIHK